MGGRPALSSGTAATYRHATGDAPDYLAAIHHRCGLLAQPPRHLIHRTRPPPPTSVVAVAHLTSAWGWQYPACRRRIGCEVHVGPASAAGFPGPVMAGMNRLASVESGLASAAGHSAGIPLLMHHAYMRTSGEPTGSGRGQTWSVGMIHSSPMAVWRGRVTM